MRTNCICIFMGFTDIAVIKNYLVVLKDTSLSCCLHNKHIPYYVYYVCIINLSHLDNSEGHSGEAAPRLAAFRASGTGAQRTEGKMPKFTLGAITSLLGGGRGRSAPIPIPPCFARTEPGTEPPWIVAPACTSSASNLWGLSGRWRLSCPQKSF